MRKKPVAATTFSSDRICMQCAWTALGDMDKGVFCYRYHENFTFKYQHSTAGGHQLKMKPCPSFHPVLADVARVAEFARYYQSMEQGRNTANRFWLSVIISIAALLVSILKR